MYKVQKSRKKIKFILKHLRKEDYEEMRVAHGENWFAKTLKITMKADVIIGQSKKTNVPIVMFGSRDVGEGRAVVWLLSTSGIEHKKFALIKNAKKELALIEQKHSFLFNCIHEKNFKMLHLLKSLGFRILQYNGSLNLEMKFFYKRIMKKGLD